MIVYAVVDDSLTPTSPLGDAIEVFIRREDAERFIDEVRDDDPDLATYLRIERRTLDTGTGNQTASPQPQIDAPLTLVYPRSGVYSPRYPGKLTSGGESQ